MASNSSKAARMLIAAKNQFASGKIDSTEYTDILHKYGTRKDLDDEVKRRADEYKTKTSRSEQESAPSNVPFRSKVAEREYEITEDVNSGDATATGSRERMKKAKSEADRQRSAKKAEDSSLSRQEWSTGLQNKLAAESEAKEKDAAQFHRQMKQTGEDRVRDSKRDTKESVLDIYVRKQQEAEDREKSRKKEKK